MLFFSTAWALLTKTQFFCLKVCSVAYFWLSIAWFLQKSLLIKKACRTHYFRLPDYISPRPATRLTYNRSRMTKSKPSEEKHRSYDKCRSLRNIFAYCIQTLSFLSNDFPMQHLAEIVCVFFSKTKATPLGWKSRFGSNFYWNWLNSSKSCSRQSKSKQHLKQHLKGYRDCLWAIPGWAEKTLLIKTSSSDYAAPLSRYQCCSSCH